MNVPGYVPAGFVRKPRSPQDDRRRRWRAPQASSKTECSERCILNGKRACRERAASYLEPTRPFRERILMASSSAGVVINECVGTLACFAASRAATSAS